MLNIPYMQIQIKLQASLTARTLTVQSVTSSRYKFLERLDGFHIDTLVDMFIAMRMVAVITMRMIPMLILDFVAMLLQTQFAELVTVYNIGLYPH